MRYTVAVALLLVGAASGVEARPLPAASSLNGRQRAFNRTHALRGGPRKLPAAARPGTTSAHKFTQTHGVRGK
jgi:hypothetical protein